MAKTLNENIKSEDDLRQYISDAKALVRKQEEYNQNRKATIDEANDLYAKTKNGTTGTYEQNKRLKEIKDTYQDIFDASVMTDRDVKDENIEQTIRNAATKLYADTIAEDESLIKLKKRIAELEKEIKVERDKFIEQRSLSIQAVSNHVNKELGAKDIYNRPLSVFDNWILVTDKRFKI